GSRLGRQELDGELLEDVPGALWTLDLLERAAVKEAPAMTRVVVAGVVMEGPPQQWRAYVLEDASVSAASPEQWARAALAAMARHGAERLVAEVNQGGELVESVIRGIDALVPYRAVRASRGKVARAEPVAALYEQGRVKHLPGLGKLEDQMMAMTVQGYAGRGSPDRVDALVWALNDLMVNPAQVWQRPQVRGL
ncbi:MAG: DNA-packaging protein, partial [Paracoccaceae bacterium]|nr:DNA-packaging protein [Paracoccaceae bacterium]